MTPKTQPQVAILFTTENDFHSRNHTELAELLRTSGMDVQVYTATSDVPGSADVVIGVNAPSAIRARIKWPRRPVIFYALEIDTPTFALSGRKSTAVLPYLRFDGCIATSQRRLGLLQTYLRFDRGCHLENAFAPGHVPNLGGTSERMGAAYVGARPRDESLATMARVAESLDSDLHIYSYGLPDRSSDGRVHFEGTVPAGRPAVVEALTRHKYGLLPLPRPPEPVPSLLSYLYTPSKLYDYLAAGLLPVRLFEDAELEVLRLSFSVEEAKHAMTNVPQARSRATIPPVSASKVVAMVREVAQRGVMRRGR